MTTTLTARWIFPVTGPPLERGTVTLVGERIVAVEPHGGRAADLDYGNAALLPGFVNAHTHLDLSGARGRVPPGADFVAWLRSVIAFRRSRTPEEVQADIQTGIAECLRLGTTLVGDIASAGASWDALVQAPLRAVVYYELLGLPHERALKALADARNWLQARPPSATCRPGWSPHAPYSVGALGFANAHGEGAQTPIPLATHLAETLAEKELLEKHTGPFVEFLRELGVWAPDQLVRGWEDVLRLTEPARPVAYAHANYLPPRAPVPAHGTLVYCPRTHAAFGHTPHPFREFLARGVSVALGTDSLASNPDLDVRAEACFLHQRHPEFPGALLLRMATLSGAEALGWADEVGSLEPGKSADMVLLALPEEDTPDPHRLLLDPAAAVSQVWVRGQYLLN